MAPLTREELIERVRRIIAVDGTDEALEALAAEIDANTPHPDIVDLIYGGSQQLSPEAVVDTALNYKVSPIKLPPAGGQP